MSLSGFGMSQGLFVRIPGLICGVQGGSGGTRGCSAPGDVGR